MKVEDIMGKKTKGKTNVLEGGEAWKQNMYEKMEKREIKMLSTYEEGKTGYQSRTKMES